MKVAITGLVRNTPAGLAKDGELEDVCNLRYKDGAWRPIADRVAIFGGATLPYTNIFIHSNAGYKHYLGLKADGTFEYFAEDINGDPTELPVPVPITTLSNPTFTQIGNVININDNGLKHLIWYDNAYVLIDSNFDGAKDSTMVGTVKVDLKVSRKGTATEREVAMYYSDGYHHGAYNYDLTSEQAINQNSITKGLFTKALGLESEEGNIHGFIFACTAIELYDGSYILHSNPVLLGQSLDKYTRYEDTFNYLTNKAAFVDAALVDESATITSGVGSSLGTPEGFTNDIDKKCYKGKSSKQYRGTANQGTGGLTLDASEHDAPNLYAQLVQQENTGSSYIYVTITGNELLFKVNTNISQSLKPLIKSVSVFITPQISIYKSETCKYIGACYFGYYGSVRYKSYNWQPEIKTNAEIIKELSELKNFYKVHEIPFDKIQAGDWTPIDLKDKLGDSLLTLQPLPIDNFSHHTTLPEVQFVYNSKLHIANYKTELSRGWPVPYFYQVQGVGQFPTGLEEVNDFTETIWAVAHIKTETGTSKVIRITNHIGTFNRTTMFSMLSYPDSRAFKLEIFTKKKFNNASTYYYFKEEYPLTASKSANFAYYINPGVKPDYPANVVQIDEADFVVPSESNREQVYQNTIKVSEVNNPFLFPAANTYQVGNGDILGLATNTVALSTGQFGQFPVYVFCTDGIYGLYVGGAEVNYSSSRPVSREVCNNPHSIKAIDTGVIFSTDKGIMVLTGSEVKELSEPLRGGIFDINKLSLFKQALNHVKLTTLLPEITSETIHSYIQSANVGYNYKDREVWFTNPDRTYSYIFSHGAWYKVKQTGSRYIDDYPKQYILNGGKLIDISSETGNYQQVYLLTRPIKMGDVEFKQMLTSVIRGRMLVENTGTAPAIQKKWAGIHVYGSYDGERWVFLGGNEKFGELNDFGTRVERTDCKYYRIAFYGNINNESYINYLELEGKQSILSTKLR